MKKKTLNVIKDICIVTMVVVFIIFVATIIYQQGYSNGSETVVKRLSQDFCITKKLFENQLC